MKRALLKTLVALAISAVSTPVFASDHPLTSTSNALPLLETIPVHGEITHIDGRRVQVQQPDGKVETYRISRLRQQRHGLAVGLEVTLGVRRLNNAVITINNSTLISCRPSSQVSRWAQ